MAVSRHAFPSMWVTALAAWLSTSAGCVEHGGAVIGQWDSAEQVYLAEASQVEVRNAQSRSYDSTDSMEMLAAVVAAYQDLGFQVEVLDEELGIVSGKKFLDLSRPLGEDLSTYLLYDEDSLVVFNRAFRTWGPFMRRADLVRLTATVRKRNAKQLIVRASAQFYLRPVENPAAYQAFYSALEKALFVERDEQSERRSPAPAAAEESQ